MKVAQKSLVVCDLETSTIGALGPLWGAAPQNGMLHTDNAGSKVNQSHYRPEVPRGFQEVKVPRLCDNGPEYW